MTVAETALLMHEVLAIYEGSDGEATKRLYQRLEALGPVGHVAVNLFRAHKSSARAKVYRGGGYRGLAYERKGWAMDNLVAILAEQAAELGIRWGWGEDAAQEYHRWVLYVDVPTGQVSFHTERRGGGPDYPAAWDGERNTGATRICRWISQLLEPHG